MSSILQMTVKEALSYHLNENGLPLDGGYEEKWTPLKFGFLTFYIYNSKARKQAVKLHDIHHVVTGYKSDLCGEAEISAWELAAGIHNKYFAGVIGLAALFYGAFLYPKRTFNAFVRGKYSRSLYSQNFNESLLEQRIDCLKGRLLPNVEPKAKLSHILQYSLLVSVASLPALAVLFSTVLLVVNYA
jgi:hypothetical protein